MFLVNAIFCLVWSHQIFANIHCLILTIFFLQNFFPLKYVESSWEAGRDKFKTQSDRLEFFAENVLGGFEPLMILAKSSILDVWLGSEYASGIFSLSWTKRFATRFLIKSSNWLNCQNDLCSGGMQLRYFLLNTYKYFNMEGR